MKKQRLYIEHGSCVHKLLVACILCGEYPYESLSLINVSRQRIIRSINILKDDYGYIAVKKRRDSKKLILKLWNKKKKEYAENVFVGGSEYEPELKISKPAAIHRKDRLAELVIMCMEAYINVTPDKKPLCLTSVDKNDPRFPYLLTSLELRKIAPVKEDKGKGARFHGLLISDGGAYIVYNMGNTLMDWVRPAEYSAMQMVEKYVHENMPWYIEEHSKYGITPPQLNHDCIIFGKYIYIKDFVRGKLSEDEYRSECPAAPNASGNPAAPATSGASLTATCTATRTPTSTSTKKGSNVPVKKRSGRRLFDIHQYYDSTYYLPLNHQGQVMLNMMSRKDWHYYLTGLFYSDNQRTTPEEYMSIGSDGKSDGNYGLIFMDGNISRLKRFLSLPITDQTRGHLKIICYDFQYEIVRDLAPDGFDVIPFPFEDITNAFYQVYEEFTAREEKD